MNFKDTLSLQTKISGHLCQVQAQYINGKVSGTVCLASSVKPLAFEFAPMFQFSKKQVIFIEIKRLFLDYCLDDKGKYSICVDVTPEDENPRNDFNLLGTSLIFLG